MEECKETLEKRKKDLEIPEKFCYWKAMTELYDEKCENLDRDQISEIFEKKAAYRKLNNSDWPSLNTDGDFCVEVVYDCEGWMKVKNSRSNPLGFFNKRSDKGSKVNPSISGNPNGEMQINPFVPNTKKKILGFVYHEGLHSVQEKINDETHLAEGEDYDSGVSLGSSQGSEESLYLARFSELGENMEDYLRLIIDALELTSRDIRSKLIELRKATRDKAERLQITSKMEDESKEYFRIDNVASFPALAPLQYPEEFNLKINILKDYLSRSDKTNEGVVFAFDEIDKLKREFRVKENEDYYKGYVGERIEVDPRLSEIHRWWLDKTSPSCEIILTKEKAKEVLDKFLSEENIAEEYEATQNEFDQLIFVYEDTQYEQEVYDALVNRLPGLVYDDSLDDSTSDYA